MQNTVSFRVAGAELSTYIDQIQKKSDQLTNTAVRGALEQVSKGKDMLKVIDEQIRATERKTRIESQAARSLFLESRETELQKNKEKYTALADTVYGNDKLTEDQKKEKLNALSGREKTDEEKIKNDYRENLTVAKETERQAAMQTLLARENVDALRQTAKDNVKAIVSGDLKLADVIKNASTEEEKLVARLTEEGVNTEKKNLSKEGGSKSIVGSLLAVDNLNKLLSSAGQLASSQNGFDMIKPAASMAGRIIGGIIGGAVGFLAGGVGAVAGAGVGASLGGTIGETTGELFQRSAVAKQDYQKAQGRWKGVTGGELPDTTNTENVGINITDFLKSQIEFAIKRGEAFSASKTATDALYADKGLGVDQSTSGMLVEMQRSAKDGNKDLAGLIGGVLEKGEGSIFKNGDHTFLNEFLGKFISLQKEALKTQSTVSTGATMDILTKFDKLGGEWAARDPRSLGNINSVQNSLAHPDTDNMKALSFGIMRDLMPVGTGIFAIRKEIEKGIYSPGYLKGRLEFIDKLGGSDDDKKNQLSGMFKGIPLSGIERIWDNRKGLMGNMDVKELQSKYKGDFKTLAEDNTAPIDKSKAHVDNSLLQDKYATIEALATAFQTAIESSMAGAVIVLNEDRGTISFPSKAAILKATTIKQAKENAAYTDNSQQVHDIPENLRAFHK